MCTYPVQPCLHIPLAHPCLYYYLLSPQYTVLHILFHCTFYPLFCFFYFILTYIYIYSRVMFHFYVLHCPLSVPVLIYISLLIISCIIEYVTNKRTLNPWAVSTPTCLRGEKGVVTTWLLWSCAARNIPTHPNIPCLTHQIKNKPSSTIVK